MLLDRARALAEKELERLAPHIERGEIAGSIRRGKPVVKDAEVVIIPKTDVFGIPRLPTDIYSRRSLIKNGDKYKQVRLLADFNLDLFIVTPPAEWGVILTIRTGPPDFSQWIVTKRSSGGALPSYAQVSNGAVWKGEEKIPMPEEQDFLDFLGLGWVEPDKRFARMNVKVSDGR